MDTLSTLDGDIAITSACAALGASRATVYRRRKPPVPRPPKPAPSSPRRLSDEERGRVLELLHAPEFVDQPPAEVYAKLLSRGVFVASVRTMYRILATSFEVRERRRGHIAHPHTKPSLVAARPNQVWTWDITKVPGMERGVFFYVYVILDLFSRFVVGWLVAERENARLATHLIAETAERHGIAPGQLTIHSDRGSPMTAGSMTQLLATMQIEQSFSRPHVSDDNPFVESHFKTAKYQPDYPGRFGSLLHVRGWFGELFDWYCHRHHHAGLALFTPADVFHGRVAAVAAVRQAALDKAYVAHPERFVHGPPSVPLPPATVSINPPPPLEAAPAKTANGSLI
jgi:putative transposase